MIEARIPQDEHERLAALARCEVLDTDPEDAFDDLTAMASRVCGTPIALVSLVDAERQWFKSRVGLGASETPRKVAYCSHAILEPDEIFIVPDALQDERFHDNPLATNSPYVRFYAGVPLVMPSGHALGTLCVIDQEPRQLDALQLETLRVLARQVVTQLELRKKCVDLRELAGQLDRSNQELQEFTRIAAHDLQEPVRKQISFSNLLEEDLGENLPADAARDLHFVKDGAQRMHALIQDLLRLSRTGTADLQREPLALHDCVAAALDDLSLRIKESGARIEIDELPVVPGDRTLLTQLFQNLLSNALKFCGEAPRLRVTCQQVDGQTVFGVQDNGIGIKEEYCQQIFQPFKRLHGRQAYAGTGVGLSIVRKAVERHGGSVWVESTPGEGSHFRFTLGAAVAAGAVGAGPTRSEPALCGEPG